LNDSESAAAGAGEREKRAWQKLQGANTRMAATTAALDALKAELADANAGQWVGHLCSIACPCSALAPDSATRLCQSDIEAYLARCFCWYGGQVQLIIQMAWFGR